MNFLLPAFSIAAGTAKSLLSKGLFGEKLSRLRLPGIAVGVVAIIVISG